jgi:dTDP-4-dehydrorhamnose reductase
MTERIVVLGSKGMLGQVAARFFGENHEVIIFNDRYAPNSRIKYIDDLIELEPSVVINCIGKIKQKTSRFEDLFVANTLLPLDLSRLPNQILIIHPSTDCVFSGTGIEPYDAFSLPNADDDYGLSKIYGELSALRREATFIVRASIIGLTIGNESSGLLDWFMRQPNGSSINGFTNHYWNGITTLEWCRIAESIIFNCRAQEVSRFSNFLQVGAEHAISKYELLVMANEVFKRNLNIIPIATAESVNRVLDPTVKIGSVRHQLEAYLEWAN